MSVAVFPTRRIVVTKTYPPKDLQHDTVNMEFLMCKVFLLGQMFAVSLSPWLLMQISLDPIFARDYACAMIGGVLGALACHSIFGVGKNVKDKEVNDGIKTMSRDAFGNLALAILFGPSVSYYLAEWFERPIDARLLIAVSGSLGLCAATIVRTLGPKLLTALSEAIPDTIVKMMGGTPKAKDSNKNLE